jgi:hypothetical protein
MLIRNVSTSLPNYTALYPRRLLAAVKTSNHLLEMFKWTSLYFHRLRNFPITEDRASVASRFDNDINRLWHGKV